MSESLEAIQQAALAEIAAAHDSRELEQLRVNYLGKKGRVTELLKQLGGMAPEERKAFGDRVNRVKDLVAGAITQRGANLAHAELEARLASETIDVTLPGRGERAGGLHPLTRTLNRIERLFNELGFERSFALMRAVGDAFVPAYRPILSRRKSTAFGERERRFQLYRRGRYVEFNLVWDRGTLFGLQSNGRTEAILMSMPPVAKWRYDWKPLPGSDEERLYREFLVPRDWANGG